MDASPSPLTPKQEALARAIASGKGVTDADALAGVPKRTSYTWRRSPEFIRRVQELRSAMTDAAMGLLAESLSGAITTLVKISQDHETPVGARVAACRAILENALRFRETLEITTRLDALESRLEEQNGKP